MSALVDASGLNKLLVCFEDITNRELWPKIQEAIGVRLPLTSITFENKFKKHVQVDELDVEFLPMKHQRIQRLRQHQHNPTTWFRLPYCHIIVVTAMETTDYKAAIRSKLNVMLNGPRGTLEALCETLIVYVRPPEADPQAKGPKKVFDRIRDDFNPKRGGNRCVRLDLYDASQLKDAQGMIVGLDALEASIKDCIKTAFHTRQTAYDEEARKLMSHRMEMRANFGTLFLVKDSLGLMLESVRLLEDALREYFELEAACLEALEEGGSLNGQPFGLISVVVDVMFVRVCVGGDEKGDDVAILMTATWKSIHQSVHANKPLKEFKLRQYLFSAKARLLFHLNRPTEVVDRGLKFIQDFTKLISQREADANLHPSFREVWAFSACLSVASTAAKFYSSRDHELQNRAGNWFGGQATAEKARIQLSEVDWDVGVCGLEDVTADLDFNSLGGQSKRTAHRFRERDVRHWHFYSSLGHLYASAREELRRIFDAIYGALETGSSAEGLKGIHADMLPSFTPVCLSASRTASIDYSRRLSLSVQKTSNLIETLQRRASTRRRMSIQGMSLGSDEQFLLDGEPMPSWMTRAGLSNTPRHQRRSTAVQIPTPLPDSPRGSVGSFVSVGSDMDAQQSTDIPDNLDATSVISYDTTMTPMTSSQVGEGMSLSFLRSAAGSSHYAGSTAPPPSESVLSSLDHPLSRTVSRKDTQSPQSLTSHALGGSGFNPETNSDSYHAGISPLLVPDKLNWVVDWRIRRALASEERYEDLFVELTLAAAWCYARCGRLRTSALLRVDVAPLLLNHGLIDAAQQLYHMKADMYLREGWNVLSGHVLPQLTACLRGDDPSRLMSACLTYLSLQKSCVDEEEVKKMMIDFRTCAQEIGSTEKTNGMQSTLIAAPTLHIAPVVKQFSELYEKRDDPAAPPLLSPIAVRRTEDFTLDDHDEIPGALLLHAGDVAYLEAEIYSALPETIVLTDVEICLTIVGDDSVSGIRSMTSMVDSSFAPSANITSPTIGGDLLTRRTYRTHSIQDLPTERIQKTSLQLFCTIDETSSDIKDGLQIQSGTTKVRFRCCPVREGFYALYYLIGEYLGTSLCLPLQISPEKVNPSWVQHPVKKKHNVVEALEFLKNRLREAVVLQVEPAPQRMEVATALPQGCCVLGLSQWIGVVLKGQPSAEMQSGMLSFSFSGSHIDAIRLPAEVNITNKAVDDAEGIDDWVAVEDGSIALPPGFLYKGLLVVWMLIDLTALPFMTRRMSDMRSLEQLGVGEFDRRADLVTSGESVDHLQTQLEYFSGCWRSHVSLVNIPVWNPFSFESSFIKMNATSMLVTIRLASQLPLVSEIESVQLELFCPRKQNCRPALIGPSFPTPLHPAEVINVAFRLTKNEAKILSASARESDEQVVSGEFSMIYRTDTYAKHKPLQSSGRSEILPTLRFPPTPQNDESVTEQNCTFRCPMELDVLLGGDGPKHDLFRISLLPPPSITLGDPVALTWMFERIGNVHSKEHIGYEIVLEAGWQACVPLSGTIFVPLKSMASATLETMFVAMSAGELQAPRLFLTQNKIQSPLVFLKVTSSDEN